MEIIGTAEELTENYQDFTVATWILFRLWDSACVSNKTNKQKHKWEKKIKNVKFSVKKKNLLFKTSSQTLFLCMYRAHGVSFMPPTLCHDKLTLVCCLHLSLLFLQFHRAKKQLLTIYLIISQCNRLPMATRPLMQCCRFMEHLLPHVSFQTCVRVLILYNSARTVSKAETDWSYLSKM